MALCPHSFPPSHFDSEIANCPLWSVIERALFHQCVSSVPDIRQGFPVLYFVVFLLPLLVCGWFLLLFDFLKIVVGLFLILFGMAFLFCLICLKPCKERDFCCFLVGVILDGGAVDFGDTLVHLAYQAVCSLSLSGCRWRGAVA